MKNLIISILAMQIITGMSFWVFSDGDDRVVMGVALTLILWVIIEALEDAITKIRRKRFMQKRRADRFKLVVDDLTKGRVS